MISHRNISLKTCRYVLMHCLINNDEQYNLERIIYLFIVLNLYNILIFFKLWILLGKYCIRLTSMY